MLNINDPHWLQTATELIALFQYHVGQTQTTWDKALEAYEGERIDYFTIRGLAKVLTDAATFTPLATPLPASQLREHLFAHGPVFASPHLFHPQTRNDVIQHAASELSISAEQIDDMLFADRPSTYLLTDTGPEWTPEQLLARYNLELARGVLYWANLVQIEVHGKYKDLWKYLKFFKLMFWVQSQQDGYTIDLDGPISPFVSATMRYGRQFAAFLPALLLCDNWSMVASVRSPHAQSMCTYRLDYTSSSLKTHFRPSGPFDS
ncbi:MAG TPA: hypothetical protein DHW02_00685, partial [Ktedonobacter sp.]|nr:hypothetical protein [Ktedonobacter sp.]